MPVDLASLAVPVCCVMGTCAYEVFHWQRVFNLKHQNQNTLPNGVDDDKSWTPPNTLKSDTHNKHNHHKKGDKIAKECEIVHENVDRKPSTIWTPCEEDFQGNVSIQEDNSSTSKSKNGLNQSNGLTLNQGNYKKFIVILIRHVCEAGDYKDIIFKP